MKVPMARSFRLPQKVGMTSVKKIFVALSITFFLTAPVAHSQVFVRIRPHLPHYVQVMPSGRRDLWLDEDWLPQGNMYVFVGGHWVQPPYEGMVWVPGHWKLKHWSWVWIAGHWR
jgi:hypothetical protein